MKCVIQHSGKQGAGTSTYRFLNGGESKMLTAEEIGRVIRDHLMQCLDIVDFNLGDEIHLEVKVISIPD